ncbi:MAG: hypothetical protein WC102_11500, partial [Saccharofermentanales bacterium]
DRKLKKLAENTQEIAEEPKVVEGFWDDEEDVLESIDTDSGTTAPGQEIPDTDEVSSKHAFIIGKFAGDNLFDDSGKLIIAKDEVITEEVISKAEEEGKLVDLIVDMKFS